MTDTTLEVIGEHFSIEGMLEVRARTRAAITAIAARIVPGMTEVGRHFSREAHTLIRAYKLDILMSRV